MPVKLPDWNTWSQYRRDELGIPGAVSRGERLQRWIEMVRRNRQKGLTRQAGCDMMEEPSRPSNKTSIIDLSSNRRISGHDATWES